MTSYSASPATGKGISMRVIRLLALLLLVFTGRALAAPHNYSLAAGSIDCRFTVSQFGLFPVTGQFADVRGRFAFDHTKQAAAAIDIEIMTASVDTGDPARDNHLRSKAFFESGTYPMMVFRSDKTVRGGKQNGQVDGNLTFRGITRPVSLAVTWQESADGRIITATANGHINRSDFNIRPDLGDFVISDRIDLAVSFTARRDD